MIGKMVFMKGNIFVIDDFFGGKIEEFVCFFIIGIIYEYICLGFRIKFFFFSRKGGGEI